MHWKAGMDCVPDSDRLESLSSSKDPSSVELSNVDVVICEDEDIILCNPSVNNHCAINPHIKSPLPRM